MKMAHLEMIYNIYIDLWLFTMIHLYIKRGKVYDVVISQWNHPNYIIHGNHPQLELDCWFCHITTLVTLHCLMLFMCFMFDPTEVMMASDHYFLGGFASPNHPQMLVNFRSVKLAGWFLNRWATSKWRCVKWHHTAEYGSIWMHVAL